jgi:maleamate amidohydrolase
MATRRRKPPAARRPPGEIFLQYQSRGIGARLGFGVSPVVLVIDFILGFTDPSSPLGADFGRELHASARLLAAARRATVPVLFTTTTYRSDLSDGGFFVRKIPSLAILQAESRWTDADPRLTPLPEEVVLVKKYASAFFGTSLSSMLTVLGADSLILAGCTTSGCVRATAVDAIQHGYRTIVPEECVGDRALEPHEASLLDLEAKYADVVPLKKVLAYLRGRAETNR